MERQSAHVRTRGDRLVVTDGEESLLRLSLRQIRQVVCYGRVELSTPFLQLPSSTGSRRCCAPPAADRLEGALVVPGAIVVAGDAEAPAVVEVVDKPAGTIVHLRLLPGTFDDHDALIQRSTLLA
jgi:hypothetical protein